MRTIKFHGFDHTPSYQGEHVPNRIKAGDTVEVSAVGAAYLVDTFAKAGPAGASAFEDVTPKPGKEK